MPESTPTHVPPSPFVPIAPAPCGKYTLVAKLGHGGMAEVFLAIASGMGGFRKLLVIKRIHAQLLEEPEFVEMFLDEARLAARLSHPNVIHTHEVGAADGLPFIAMEYLEGQSLERIQRYANRRNQPLPAPLVARIIADALAGIQYAHDLRDYDGTPLGVVHRDISPSNICVTYQGVVKILDFGIAKATTKMVVTRAGRIKGKFSYMAPEQARSIDVDARADIWSVGVVLWELLTKHRLFKAETEIKTLERLLGDDMKEVLRPVAGVPEELLVIARRALEREREQRYATASEMREALEGYLSSQQPVTNADVGRFVSTVFDDVIEQHQKALGNILARAGAVDSAVTLDIDIEDSRDTSAPLLHVGHKQSRHSWPTESGARRRDKPRGLQQRSILVAAAIVGVAVIAAAWLARGPDESTSRRPSADADTEMDLEPSPAHPPTPPSAPAVAPLPPAAAASAPLVQAATSPEAIAQEQEQEQESSARVGRRQRPRGRQQRAATQRAAPAHEPSSDTQQTVEHEAPAPPAAQEEFGFLTIDTSPWSEVFLNGRSLGPTPLIRARLPAGSHVLSLRNSERGISMQYSVSIRPGQLTTRRLGL